MAKSNISDLYVSDLDNRKESPYDNDVINFTRQGANREINLACLDHLFADLNQPQVECSARFTVIDKLKQQIKSHVELGRTSSAHQLNLTLQSFIRNADNQQLEAFSKESWKSYFGAKGYMWRLVESAERQYAQPYMYDDGQVIGISEKTAAGTKRLIPIPLINLPIESNL